MSIVATLERPPLAYAEEADALFVDLHVFQVRFCKDTAGYDQILKDGRVVVEEVRWFLQDGKGKQVGEPYKLEWEIIDDYTLRVTRFYKDYDGTDFAVVQECRSDDRIKTSVEGVVGKSDSFSLVWSASGIVSPSITHEEERRKVSCFEFGILDSDVVFDYSDVYEQLGDVTTVEISGKAGGRKVDLTFGIGNFTAGQEFSVDPSTVGATSTRYALNTQQIRKAFHANGRFWIFYGDGTDFGYRTSTDGAAWSDLTVLFAGIGSLNTSHCAIWFDGTYFCVTRLDTGTDTAYYRRGIPEANGTIAWSAAEQTAITSCEMITGLCVDSEGYPWIGYISSGVYRGKVSKSSTNDSTWVTAAGFPYTIRSELSYPFVVPLTEGKVYAMSCAADNVIYGRLWGGDSWGDQETITTSVIEYAWAKSAVVDLDDVHLVFNEDVDDHIIYVKRTYGVGWGDEETVQASAAESSYPIISIDGDGTLYCFWTGSPTADHVYYKKCVVGSWDASPTDWIDETISGIWSDSSVTGYYGAYDGYVGFAYLAGTVEANLTVRHEYLSGLTAFTPVTVYPVGWLSGWAKRVKITVDHLDIESALANLPVLVYLSPSSGHSSKDVSCVFDELGSDANRKKIAITKADGVTKCYIEIEKWDDANEKAWLWLKVPDADPDVDTDLYLYYDSTHADNDAYVGDTNSEVAENAWAAIFKAVYHFRDGVDNEHIYDSTSNDLDGTKQAAGEPFETAAGIIDGAQDADTYIVISNLTWTPVDGFTISWSMYPRSASDWNQIIMSIIEWGGFSFHTQNGGGLYVGTDAGTRFVPGDLPTLALDTLQRFTYTHDGVQGRFYKDGALVAGPKNQNVSLEWVGGFTWGHNTWEPGRLDAIIDEGRISIGARSAAWEKASYESERDHLLDFGAEENLFVQYYQTIEDILGLVDALPTPKGAFKKSVSDILGMAESSPSVGSFHLTASDHLGLLDIMAPRADFKQHVVDQLGMLDTAAPIKGLYQTIVESLDMVEFVAGRADLKAEAAESLGLLDTTEAQSALKQVVTEILGLLETTDLRSDQKQAVTEVLGMLDGIGAAKHLYQAIMESLGMIDVIMPRADFKIETIESLGLLDTTESRSAFKQTITEILGFLDTTAPRSDLKQTVTEIIDLVDSASSRGDYKQVITDSLEMADVVYWPWAGVLMVIGAQGRGIIISGLKRDQDVTDQKRKQAIGEKKYE